jgi:heat shock protein HtpX
MTRGSMFNFNTLKTTILLGALTGLLVLLGGWLGGSYGAVFGLAFALVMNFGSYWFSDQIALKLAGAREVSYLQAPELHDAVARVARRFNLPKPRVAVVEADAPNAFATGRNPEHGVVAVTTGLLRLLDRRELEAVLAHEVGHIQNRDILVSAVAATIAGAVTMMAQMAQWAMIFGGRDDEDNGGGGLLGGLLMIILAPLAAMIIQLAVSRSREFGADTAGAHTGGDPLALASALEKLEAYSKRIPLNVSPAASHLFIVKPLTGFAFQNLFSSHPPTEERVARLRQIAQEERGVRLNSLPGRRVA